MTMTDTELWEARRTRQRLQRMWDKADKEDFAMANAALVEDSEKNRLHNLECQV